LKPIGDCGVTKGCYLFPTTCISSSNDCQLVFKWSDNGETTDFELSSKITVADDVWLGIGFSKNASMGDNGAVLCIHTSNNVADVQSMYNAGKVPPTLLDKNDPSVGIANKQVSIDKDEMTCTFNRFKKKPDVVNYFDLNNEYFLLTANGPYQEG
jgi:hypothetical protein